MFGRKNSNLHSALFFLSLLFLSCGVEPENTPPITGDGMRSEAESHEKLELGSEKDPPFEKSFALSFEKDQLSARIEKVLLKDVMKVLAELTGIESYLEGSVGDNRISVIFSQLSIEEGIKKILSDNRYVLAFTSTESLNGSSDFKKVTEIHVSQGNPEDKILEGPISPASGKSEEAAKPERAIQDLKWDALQDNDPLVRLSALKEITSRDSEEESRSTVELALRDPDPHVRQLALEVLNEEGVVSRTSLSELSLRDPSPEVRKNALILSIEADEEAGKDLLERAQWDEDSNIRALATTLLKNLNEGMEDLERPPTEAPVEDEKDDDQSQDTSEEVEEPLEILPPESSEAIEEDDQSQYATSEEESWEEVPSDILEAWEEEEADGNQA